jgi:hypothetical protein
MRLYSTSDEEVDAGTEKIIGSILTGHSLIMSISCRMENLPHFWPVIRSSAARWQPELYLTNYEQWRRPIQQILTYSNEIQCRYGFLLTDRELVVFQFAKEHVGPGIATTRGTRQTQATQTHRRVLSGVSQLSESVQAMSISIESSSGAQSYVESGQGLEYQDPKYRIIPWENEGEEKLTVKLALFYLCMMAGYGSRHVSSGYPCLNTWWRLADGAFGHNTSGLTKRQLGPGDKMEDPAATTQRLDNTGSMDSIEDETHHRGVREEQNDEHDVTDDGN